MLEDGVLGPIYCPLPALSQNLKLFEGKEIHSKSLLWGVTGFSLLTSFLSNCHIRRKKKNSIFRALKVQNSFVALVIELRGPSCYLFLQSRNSLATSVNVIFGNADYTRGTTYTASSFVPHPSYSEWNNVLCASTWSKTARILSRTHSGSPKEFFGLS